MSNAPAEKIVLLAIVSMLGGCGYVPDNEIHAAQKACEPNGGVRLIRAHSLENYFEALCNNGLSVEGSTNRE